MRRFLLSVLLLTAMLLPALSDPTPPVPALSLLQAVPDGYDFGSRSVLDTSPIAHRFVLTSHAKIPVTVDRLQPSCHCTHASAEREADGYGRFTLPPGQSVGIDVTIDPSDMAPGDVEKEVYVFADGDSTPAVTLHLTGHITPAVSFSPPTLDFGRMTARASRSQTLTVTVDPRLLVPGQAPHLTCSDPAIRVALQTGTPPLPGAPLCRTYRVTIPAGLRHGIVHATLLFSPDDDPNSSVWSTPLRAQITSLANRDHAASR